MREQLVREGGGTQLEVWRKVVKDEVLLCHTDERILPLKYRKRPEIVYMAIEAHHEYGRTDVVTIVLCECR